ncbi:MAG: Na(+)/H(+) antiporter subunit B [Micromonosporaceae bacterium]
MFWVLDYLCLALILAAAGLVVTLRNLNGAVMALSAAGTVLSALFVVLGAPDVAHSQIVVGAIALPVLYLVAIGKSRTDVADEKDLGEQGEQDEGGGAHKPGLHKPDQHKTGGRRGGESIGARR